MMVLFHNIECGNKGNKLNSWLLLLLLLSLFPLDCIGLAYGAVGQGARGRSVTELDNSSASKVARERLSSISPSLPPNEIMLLAAAEGH